MAAHVPGDKYILFLKPAVEDWNHLDNSLCYKIERQITDFQTDWGPSNAFSKNPSETETENIYQIKHKRGTVRAFAAWWNEDSIHVLCILSLYKKENESSNWDCIDDYDSAAEDKLNELSTLYTASNLRTRLDELDNKDEYRVIEP